MDISILLSLGIIIIASTVVAIVARRFKQPVLFAYILAGVIIGPLVLNLVPNHADILVLSELGVAFLLFAVGIESDVSKILKMKYVIAVGGLLQVGITSASVFLLMRLVGLPFMESVYVGAILAFSSTVISIKYLSEKNEISTLHGRLIIGYAIVQDILVILVLPLLAKPETLFSIGTFGVFAGSLVLLFGAAIALSRFVLPKLLGHHASHQELFFLIVISVCLGFMYLANSLGFSIAIGAFVGGLALSNLPYTTEASSRITGLRDFFATIFFVSLGMQLTLGFVGFPLMLIVAMFLVIYLLNPTILFLITYFAGYGSRTSLKVGLALEQASEFSFIIASQGLVVGMVSGTTYSIAVLVIVVSMTTTPYLLENNDRIYKVFNKGFRKILPKYCKTRFSRRINELENLPGEGLKNHAVVFGSGMFGGGLVDVIKNYAKVVVVDYDPNTALSNTKKKLYSVYGSARDAEVWKKVNLGNAKMVVCTVPSPRVTLAVLKEVKRINRKCAFFARAHTYREALEMYRRGAESVVLPQVLAGNECLKEIANFLEGKKSTGSMREEYMDYLKKKVKEEERCTRHKEF